MELNKTSPADEKMIPSGFGLIQYSPIHFKILLSVGILITILFITANNRIILELMGDHTEIGNISTAN